MCVCARVCVCACVRVRVSFDDSRVCTFTNGVFQVCFSFYFFVDGFLRSGENMDCPLKSSVMFSKWNVLTRVLFCFHKICTVLVLLSKPLLVLFY